MFVTWTSPGYKTLWLGIPLLLELCGKPREPSCRDGLQRGTTCNCCHLWQHSCQQKDRLQWCESHTPHLAPNTFTWKCSHLTAFAHLFFYFFFLLFFPQILLSKDHRAHFYSNPLLLGLQKKEGKCKSYWRCIALLPFLILVSRLTLAGTIFFLLVFSWVGLLGPYSLTLPVSKIGSPHTADKQESPASEGCCWIKEKHLKMATKRSGDILPPLVYASASYLH